MQKCQQISCRNNNGKLLLDFLSVFFQDVAAQFDNYRQLSRILHLFQQFAAAVVKGQNTDVSWVFGIIEHSAILLQ